MAVSAKLLSGSLNNISSVAITSREYNGSTTLGASFLNTPVALTGVRTEFVRTYTCTEATVTQLRWGYRVVANNGAAINLTIRFYHAHMNPGAVLHPYHATTTAPYYAPRFDYDPTTHAIKGLLIEPQRTNSIRNSTMVGAVAGTSAPTYWGMRGVTTDGVTRELADVGITANGKNYITWRISGTPTATGSVFISYDGVTPVITAAKLEKWTHSVDLAVLEQGTSITNVVSIKQGIDTYKADGSFIGNNFSVDRKALLTATLQRVADTVTLADDANIAKISALTFRVAFTQDAPIDLYIMVAAPQLELGASATSWVPSYSASATRAADAVSFTIPTGMTLLRYTFDDNSTQDVAVTAGAYTVPTDLNRAHIKRIAGFKS